MEKEKISKNPFAPSLVSEFVEAQKTYLLSTELKPEIILMIMTYLELLEMENKAVGYMMETMISLENEILILKAKTNGK